VVYGCDPAWWKSVQGLPNFHGLKIAWSGAALEYPDVRKVEIAKEGKRVYSWSLHPAPGSPIGGGGSSAFQALNLALQWGARKIILVGCDNTDAHGLHWYGRNNWQHANNPDAGCFRRWNEAFDAAPRVLREIGAEVINCSPLTALKTFPVMSIEDALKRFA
jgi:hypothetical protein